jgi:hypothetical protein
MKEKYEERNKKKGIKIESGTEEEEGTLTGGGNHHLP